MKEHLNITPIQIILSYQAQPQTNNLDKLENPNTPPHTSMNTKARHETQLTPLVERIQLIITGNVKRHTYTNYQTPPSKFQPGSAENPRIIG